MTRVVCDLGIGTHFISRLHRSHIQYSARLGDTRASEGPPATRAMVNLGLAELLVGGERDWVP